MSSTTTMVRWYCEYLYNQVINDNTKPPNNWITDVNTIIPAVWEKIFYEFPIWKNPIVLPSAKRFYGIITSGKLARKR